MQKQSSSPQLKKQPNLAVSPRTSPRSAKKPIDSRGFLSPSSANLRQPNSASKVYYVNDQSPSNKDELEIEIMGHLKTLKEMKNEMGAQKNLISSYIGNLQSQHNVNIDIQTNNPNSIYKGLWATPAQTSSQKNLRLYQSTNTGEKTPEMTRNRVDEDTNLERKEIGAFQNQVNKAETTYQKILSNIRQDKGSSPQIKKSNIASSGKDNKHLLNSQKSMERRKSTEKNFNTKRGVASQNSSINEIKDSKRSALSPNRSMENGYKPSSNRVENISNIEIALKKQRDRKPIEVILGVPVGTGEDRKAVRTNQPNSVDLKKTYKNGSASPCNQFLKTSNRPEVLTQSKGPYKQFNQQQQQQRENDYSPIYFEGTRNYEVEIDRKHGGETQKNSRAPIPREIQDEIGTYNIEPSDDKNQPDYVGQSTEEEDFLAQERNTGIIYDQPKKATFNEQRDEQSDQHQGLIQDLYERIKLLSDEISARDEYIKRSKVEEEEQIFRLNEEISNRDLELQKYAHELRANTTSDNKELLKELEIQIKQFRDENKDLRERLYDYEQRNPQNSEALKNQRDVETNKSDYETETNQKNQREASEDDSQQDIDIEASIVKHEQEAVYLYYELQGRYNDLQSQIESLKYVESQNNQLNQELNKHKGSDNQDNTRVQFLESEIKDLSEKCSSLEANLEDFTQVKQTLIALKGDFVNDKVNSKITSLIKQYEASQDELVQVKEENKSIRLKLKDETQTGASRYEELKQENEALKDQIRELEHQIKQNNSQEIIALQDTKIKLQELEDDKRKIDEDIVRILNETDSDRLNSQEPGSLTNKDLNQVSARFRNIQLNLNSLESETGSQKNQISELTHKNQNLEEAVRKINEELNHAKAVASSSYENTESIQKELHSRINDLEKEKANVETQNNELTETVQELEEELKENLRKLISSEETLKLKVNRDLKLAELEKEKHSLEQIIEQKNVQLNTVEKDLESTRGDFEVAEKERRALQKKQKESEEEAEKLKNKINDSENSLKNELEILKIQNYKAEAEVIDFESNTKQVYKSLEEENKRLSALVEQLQKESSSNETKGSSEKKASSSENSEYAEIMQQIRNLQSIRNENQMKIDDLESESKLKDKQIESLKFDLNHMKDFLLQHHGDLLYGQNPNEQEEPKSRKTSEFKAPSTNLDVVSINSIREANDTSENPPKVSKISDQGRRSTQILRSQTLRDPHESGFKRLSMNFSLKSEESALDPSQLRNSTGKIRNRKELDLDPIYKSLEGIIRELQEKLSNNEKNVKKQIESKILEENEKFAQHEKSLLAEIENLKQEKNALIKKFDDIEWQKAYEYTNKVRSEGTGPSGNNNDQTNSQIQPGNTDNEGKKKKKKRNKQKIEENV